MKNKIIHIPPNWMLGLLLLFGQLLLLFKQAKSADWHIYNNGDVRVLTAMMCIAIPMCFFFGHTFYEEGIAIQFCGIPLKAIPWSECKYSHYKREKIEEYSHILITTNRFFFHWIYIGITSLQLEPCIEALTKYVGPVANWDYEHSDKSKDFS